MAVTRSPRTDGGPPAGERRHAPWRRALSLAVTAWTVAALALPGEALASPGATHDAALAAHHAWASADAHHAQLPHHARGEDTAHDAAHAGRHHASGSSLRASADAHHVHPAIAKHDAGMGTEHCGGDAPSSHHAHHADCHDCCCAAPISGLPAAAAAFAPPVVSHLPTPEASPEETPRAGGDFLHPFPNGPPLHRA